MRKGKFKPCGMGVTLSFIVYRQDETSISSRLCHYSVPDKLLYAYGNWALGAMASRILSI